VSTTLFGVAELFYFAVPLILRNADYLKSFSADQRTRVRDEELRAGSRAAYAFDALLLPMLLAGLSMTVWLLVRGVDVVKWEEKVATSGQ